MKKIAIVTICLSVILPLNAGAAKFSDVLEQMFVPKQQSAIGQDEYVFAPGDVAIKRENYKVYYSGIESMGGVKNVMFTLVEDRNQIILKYPNPQTIRIRKDRLKVLSYDNESLKVRILR